MKIKLFALLVCVVAVSTLCYATNSKDYMPKNDWKTLSDFYKKVKTCTNARANINPWTFKVYKNGNYCIYEETNLLRHRTTTCEFPLPELKLFTKNVLDFNSIVLDNLPAEEMQALFDNEEFIEYTNLQSKYCK